ncbi:MAG: hypothetical protein ABDH23_05285 [Endomicrobiia bacterium]
MIIVLGFVFILTGLLYFYFPHIIIGVFQIIKKYIINEKVVILNNKKIGLFLISAGVIFILVSTRKIFIKNELYNAYREYYLRNFDKAEKICLDLLNKKPNDIDSMLLLGKIYFSSEKYLLAKATFLRVASMSPEKKQYVEKFIQLIDTKYKKNEN